MQLAAVRGAPGALESGSPPLNPEHRHGNDGRLPGGDSFSISHATDGDGLKLGSSRSLDVRAIRVISD